VLDVGTADGLMLDYLADHYPGVLFLGLERNAQLLKAETGLDFPRINGDALDLPFSQDSIDAVIATAVIEHVTHPDRMVLECRRILRKGGLLVVTTPVPSLERLASALGILKEAGHHKTFGLGELCQLLEEKCFEIVESRKFMFSPIGFPAERVMERVFGPIGLKYLMANQLVVASRR
jgi:ubiquinone/menaquinone biosynthesis C-methylase UbiE